MFAIASHLILAALFCFCLPGCTSAQLSPSSQASSIDAQYQFSRWKARTNHIPISLHVRQTRKPFHFNEKLHQNVVSHNESPGIQFYQAVISQTLGSHCTYFPSDSQYTQLLFKTCGPLTGIVRAMSRFYMEPDAPTRDIL